MAGGLSGYTVLVRADGPPRTPPSRDEITAAFAQIAPPTALERRLEAEPHMTLVDLACDVFVAGGGMAGVCAAVAAARHGAKVVLVQDRSRLGGNASSEVKMHIVGADCHGGRPGWREGGLIEEFRLDDAVEQSPAQLRAVGSAALRQGQERAEHHAVARQRRCSPPRRRTDQIQRVMVRCDKTEHLYRITAQALSRLHRRQPARRSKPAPRCAGGARPRASSTNRSRSTPRDRQTLGLAASCSPRATTAARALHAAQVGAQGHQGAAPVPRRSIRGNTAIGGSSGAASSTPSATTNASASSCCPSSWACGITSRTPATNPTARTGAWIGSGMIPGKRETRRIVGDHILTQHDLEGEDGRVRGRRGHRRLATGRSSAQRL